MTPLIQNITSTMLLVSRSSEQTRTVDSYLTWIIAVTHEVVQPQVHEIVEEQITRDFHTYDEYRYIQPVYELEILPARHFVEGVDGGLVEVSESDLPDCTGANQRWEIAERQVLTGTHRQFDIIAKQVDEGKTLVPGKNLLLGKHVGSAKHADEARLLEH